MKKQTITDWRTIIFSQIGEHLTVTILIYNIFNVKILHGIFYKYRFMSFKIHTILIMMIKIHTVPLYPGKNVEWSLFQYIHAYIPPKLSVLMSLVIR